MRAVAPLTFIVAGACQVPGRAPAITYAPHTVLDIPADGDIADPHVIKIGSTWHLYATHSKVDLEVWLSEDLRSWRSGGTVWTQTPDTWNAQGEVWAPHVEATEDGYYLYYTAAIQIGVARADSPLGPFRDRASHPLVGGGHGGIGDGVFERGAPFDFEEYAIDPFLLRAGDGSLALYFTAYDPVASIRMVPMLDYETLAPAAPRPVLEADPLSWEGFVVEGPWVQEHAGDLLLMYSGNWADTTSYALGVARGAAAMGPFTRNPNNPLLRSNPDAGFYGPGHHSVVEGAAGDLLMFYHTKSSPERGWDRRIRYAAISFDAGGNIVLEAPPP